MLKQGIIAEHKSIFLEEGKAALPWLVGKIAVIAQIPDPAKVREGRMPCKNLPDVGCCQVCVGDDAVWNSAPVGRLLKPFRLDYRVGGPSAA